MWSLPHTVASINAVICFCMAAYLTRCEATNISCEADGNTTSVEKDNKQMTHLLDSLLVGYKKYMRPGMGGPPLPVTLNILIRSMGPISEEDMMFSMDCYFRQEWRDPRLGFKPIGDLDILRPSIFMLEYIWKPDTFILNGHNSYLHTITYSNKLFRIYHTGDILYSQRLTIKSSCPMHLNKYPLDSQTCPLFIGSFGYSDHDVLYQWKENLTSGPVRTYKDITMAQFTMTGITHGNTTSGPEHGGRQVLSVQIDLKREIGYYLLQIYLPIYLIVIISWVSFWINREATPARVMLGITTLLTTCTIAITGREGIPKVSYSTALDVFLLLCFSFVFAALVEYAAVNYFTKGGVKEILDDSEDESDATKPLIPRVPPYTTSSGSGQARTNSTSEATRSKDINGHLTRNFAVNCPQEVDSCCVMFLHCLKGNTSYRYMKSRHRRGPVSVSKIDSLARILFPFSFICLNILYWAGFLYYF